MSFSSSMKKTAKGLLNRYADDIEIVKVTQGVYDPSTGESPKTEVIIKSKGYPESYDSSQLVQDVINSDDIRMIIETDEEITKQDLIEYRGSRYEIVSVADVRAQNTTIIYTLQIRR